MELLGLARLVPAWFAPGSDPRAASRLDATDLGFSEANAFRRQLEEVHGRCRSTRRPLSAVALRCGTAGVALSGAEFSARHRMLASVARHVRDTDLKHFDGRQITVLLPDTSLDRAAIVGRRLSGLFGGGGERRASPREVVVRHWPVIDLGPAPPQAAPPALAGPGERTSERVAGGDRREPDGGTAGARRGSGAAFAKRAVDLVGATAGLVLLLPLMVLIAAAVKLTSPGPALFRQQRVGRGGRVFSMLKFRTMRNDAGDEVHREYIRSLVERGALENRGTAGRPVFKLANDARVTPLGAWLRRYSFDELPQFWNVVVGDMSLVGPRPSVHYELESYRPWHFDRLQVKPGLTGLWQVRGRARTTFDDMVRMDLRYVKQSSLLLDLRLIAATFAVVLRREGGL